MKMFRKITATLLCVLTLFTLPLVSANAAKSDLKFNSKGEFKIVIFADSQDDETLAPSTTALMEVALKKEKPNLVIFLGDNTVAQGYKKQKKAIEVLVEPCLKTKTPFAIVFGNHDQENGVKKETLLKIYRDLGCLTYDAKPEIYGCGNCNLPIYSSKGNKLAFNLWFFDSGSSNPDKEVGGYDYVRKSQINWYKETEKALKAKNGGKTVPSLNFQHIIPVEAYEALGMIELPISYKEWQADGKYYLPIPAIGKIDGFAFESPSSSYKNAGHIDALINNGKVLGTFVGHDHVNSFTANYKGMNITNVPSVGNQSYNKHMSRGYGVITLNEKDLSTYNYTTEYYSELAVSGKYDTLLKAEDAENIVTYYLATILRNLLIAITEASVTVADMIVK